MSQWDSLHYKAKTLEVRLENKVQNYSAIAQRINANFIHDEENPLIENNEEQVLASEIEHDLGELYDCIDTMKCFNNSSLTNQQESLVKRYREIHFDFSNEFKNTSAAVQRKRESMELMASSRSLRGGDDSAEDKLMRENTGLMASMKSINEVIRNAFETKNALAGQRSTLGGSTSTLNNISANVPGFGSLIDGIQKKKGREKMIIGVVVALLLCFTIWWIFLR